ncbi:MAG: chemotaxis protein CheC [Halobacteriales archaeon]|nr:chemotaxis protein CheC [Halobacteriales archaeon]
MQIDVHSLETFNRLAHEGAEEAAASLTKMTGIETAVSVTQTSLMTTADLSGRLEDDELIGIKIGFEGELDGETMLVFDESTAARIVDVLIPGESDGEFDAMAQSGLEEIGNIMIGGFTTGWSEYLGSAIEISPPTYIDGSVTDVLDAQSEAATEDEHLFVLESQIEFIEEQVECGIYMLPGYRTLLDAIAERSDTADQGLPLEKLTVYQEMTTQGAERVADNITSMAGVDTCVDISRLSFVPVERIPSRLDDTPHVGVVFEFEGLPSGYLVIAFDEQSAYLIAEELMPMETDMESFGDIHESAIRELSNIMTSGLVDGWANVLETTIEISTPQMVADMGSALLDPVMVEIGRDQSQAFMLDSTIGTDELDFSCEIFAIPREDELRNALDQLAIDRADELEADPTSHF